jgi:hypothetical protein
VIHKQRKEGTREVDEEISCEGKREGRKEGMKEGKMGGRKGSTSTLCSSFEMLEDVQRRNVIKEGKR